MKSFLLALAAALALSAPVAAQPVGSPQNITVVDSGTACVTAPTACATFALDSSTGSLSIGVTGTWTGTLTFEGTNNNGVWTSLGLAKNLATGAEGATTTASGLFTITNAGVILVRVRATAAITGTAIVTAAKGLGFARSNALTAPETITASGIAVTSTDGEVLTNPTLATSGVPVQMSPRLKWCGTAYNSVSTLAETDCAIAEVLPATNAGTTLSKWNLSFSLNGGAYTNRMFVQSNGSWSIGTITVDSAGAAAGFAGLTNSGVYQLSGITLVSPTAPTVTSAGTSPSVTASNGTATFRVNVGTGGTATTIVLAMPAATAGWNCSGSNLTAAAANRNPTGVLLQQSSTTTAATLQYQTVATGVALAFVASDIVKISCTGF